MRPNKRAHVAKRTASRCIRKRDALVYMVVLITVSAAWFQLQYRNSMVADVAHATRAGITSRTLGTLIRRSATPFPASMTPTATATHTGAPTASATSTWTAAAPSPKTSRKSIVLPPRSSPLSRRTGVRSRSPATLGFKTISDLLYELHPVGKYADPSLGHYTVTHATTWFGSTHPAFPETANVCPASGCTVTLAHAPQYVTSWSRQIADVQAASHILLFHMDPNDFPDNAVMGYNAFKDTPMAEVNSAEGKPLGMAYRHAALFAGENFMMNIRGLPWSQFSTEMSFRPSSFLRESYVLRSLAEGSQQGVPVPSQQVEEGVWDLQARVWEDLWPAPVPWDRVREGAGALATWASHYCKDSASGREDLVRELTAAGLQILILGDAGNCLRNAPEEILAMDRAAQAGEMRKHVFHLAFENVRLPGYVTEKFYWALVRGQIPVVWGAPDIARHAPSNESYIDASLYSNDIPALVARMTEIAGNKTLHEGYHAWRRGRSFESYGDILRSELVEMVWLSNSTPSDVQRYQCRLCHGVRRFEAQGGFNTTPTFGIRNTGEDFAPPFISPSRLRPVP